MATSLVDEDPTVPPNENCSRERELTFHLFPFNQMLSNRELAHPPGRVQYPVTAGVVYFVLKPGSQHWGLCIPRESEKHVIVDSVSLLDAKDPRMTTSTLAVTILSASIERSAWCKCYEKD